MIKSYAAVLLLMATSAHKTDKNNKLEDNDGSTRYQPVPDIYDYSYEQPKYKGCASGCTCDGSLSIVSAFMGIKDVTAKISSEYAQGKTKFLASSKHYVDGYKKPYIYDTLSITYQQFCKYTTVTVPNIDLAQHRPYAVQHKDAAEGASSKHYGGLQPKNHQPYCSDIKCTAPANTDQREQLQIATQALCSILELKNAITGKCTDCQQVEAFESLEIRGRLFFNAFTALESLIDNFQNLLTTCQITEYQAALHRANEVLRTLKNGPNAGAMIYDDIPIVDPGVELNLANFLSTYNLFIRDALDNDLDDDFDTLMVGLFGNCNTDGLFGYLFKLFKSVCMPPPNGNLKSCNVGSAYHHTYSVAQVDGAEGVGASENMTLAQTNEFMQAAGKVYPGYGGHAPYGAAPYKREYKKSEFCLNMLPDHWSKFVITIPAPINLPGKKTYKPY